jgi:tetratricopeptide (TPR) repeat protein
MSIAQRFLDEPHKFYILARFNGVNDPSRLTAGRTIRVPGQRDVAESNVATTVTAAVDSRVRRARHFHDAGKYQQAIDLLEGSATGNSDERDLLVLSYEKYAGELQRQRNFDGARTLLEKALAIRPANEGLRAQLRNVEKQREIDANYQAAMDAIAAGDNPRALDSFNAVLKLDPAHEEANKQIARLRTDAAESIHRDALVEYNKQNLDKAIDLWDHVLALLPTHQNAKLYRARAIDLRYRLLKLQTN